MYSCPAVVSPTSRLKLVGKLLIWSPVGVIEVVADSAFPEEGVGEVGLKRGGRGAMEDEGVFDCQSEQ